MIFGQLIKYNLRNKFIEKSYTKCFGETIPRPFLTNQNCAYLWINILKYTILYSILYFVFVCQVEDYRNWLKLSCRTLAFNSYKVLKKTKRGLELVSLLNFLPDFWRKIFLLLYSLTRPNFNVWLALLSWDIGQYVNHNSLLTRSWRKKILKLTLSF